MISGAHILFYSKDSEADRAFFRDVLGFRGVDAGHGWLIFALPASEAAFHPIEDGAAVSNPLGASFYLMCDDVHAFIKRMEAKGVTCTAIQQQAWGNATTIRMPSGGELGLYQPLHPTALNLK